MSVRRPCLEDSKATPPSNTLRSNAAQVETLDNDDVLFRKRKMSSMFFGPEFFDGEIIDTHKLNAAFDKKLRSLRLHINKLLVERTVLPVFGVFRFKQHALDAVPLQRNKLSLPDGPNTGNFKNGRFADEPFQRNLMQPLAVLDEMIRERRCECPYAS